MPITPVRITATPEWQALSQHFLEVRDLHLRDLFAQGPQRAQSMTVEAVDLLLDYSKNRMTSETVNLLVAVAERAGLRQRAEAMFSGEHINVTEDRAVLHVALRAQQGDKVQEGGADVVPQVHEVLGRMASFADDVRSGTLRGFTGKRIRRVVNIGIGGSDLGPAMAYEALLPYTDREMSFGFVSNVDGSDIWEATAGASP